MPPDVIDLLVQEVRELRKEVAGMRSELAEQRGARRGALFVVSTFGAALGTGLTLATKFFGLVGAANVKP